MLNEIKDVLNILQESYTKSTSDESQKDFQKIVTITTAEALTFGGTIDKALAIGTLCAVKNNSYVGMSLGSCALTVGRIKRYGIWKELGFELAATAAVLAPKFL